MYFGITKYFKQVLEKFIVQSNQLKTKQTRCTVFSQSRTTLQVDWKVNSLPQHKFFFKIFFANAEANISLDS